ISSNGRIVAYESDATNAVPGQVDTNNAADVFLFDRQAGTTILVSRAAGALATAANGLSSYVAVSADGRYVAYTSFATDLVSGFVDSNAASSGADVFLFDSVTGINTSVGHKVGQATFGGNAPRGALAYSTAETQISTSDDGGFVVHRRFETDLVSLFSHGNGASADGLYLFDRQSGANVLVS